MLLSAAFNGFHARLYYAFVLALPTFSCVLSFFLMLSYAFIIFLVLSCPFFVTSPSMSRGTPSITLDSKRKRRCRAEAKALSLMGNSTWD